MSSVISFPYRDYGVFLRRSTLLFRQRFLCQLMMGKQQCSSERYYQGVLIRHLNTGLHFKRTLIEGQASSSSHVSLFHQVLFTQNMPCALERAVVILVALLVV